jgi:hypothetical protein
MSELKTQKTAASAAAHIAAIQDPERRRDCKALAAMMKAATGARAAMWGTAIVGFGDYRYRYASGREGDWFLVGFASRKSDLTLYLMSIDAEMSALLKQLGPHKRGGGCLYVKRLSDVRVPVLKRLIAKSISASRRRAAALKKTGAK